MKIFDCFSYWDEDFLLDLRLNILNDYVDFFVIVEGNKTWQNNPKKLKFDISKFQKFKDKIIYIVLENQPSSLLEIKESDNSKVKINKILDNALIRENFQRNFCFQEINKFPGDDLIIINDLDEIPNLINFSYRNKITIFKQKMIYYKFNLKYPNYNWMGSKICKIKHLLSPQWL